MSETRVRLATEHDTDSIVDLWLEMMAVHQALAPLAWTLSPEASERYREHLANMLQDANRRIFVAEQEAKVIGYLIVGKSERPPVLVPATRGLFEEICVTALARREGVGRRLVAAAMEWFREEGLPMAEVGYAVGNPMSVPFWEGLGFRPHMVRAAIALPGRENDA